MSRNLKSFMYCENKAKEWAVIGGGPSINDCVSDIRKLQRRGVNIVSVNKSHDWLLDNHIIPWGHVLLDPKEWVADYVKRPRKDVRYFVASQCHADTFDALKDYPVFLWHAAQDFPEGPEPNTYLKEKWSRGKNDWYCVLGDTTVAFRASRLGHAMGADKFHMFGVDSSRAPQGAFHGYSKPEAPDTACPDIFLKYAGMKYRFQTNTHMLRQQMDFDQFVEQLPELYERKALRKEFTITVYGSGLLPFFAARLGWHANSEFNKDPSKVGGYVEAVPDRLGYLGGLSIPTFVDFNNVAVLGNA